MSGPSQGRSEERWMTDAAIRRLLNEILDHQVANRGTEHEFYKCYTYSGNKMPPWVKKAERVVERLSHD